MAAALAAALTEHLLDTFPPERPQPRAVLRDGAMPPLVGRLLDAALEQRVRDHLADAPDWIDATDEGVKHASHALLLASLRAARIPARDWPDAVAEAATTAVDFLVRPAQTATRYAFRDADEPQPVQEVLRRMDALNAYTYLHEVAARYFDKKEIETVTPESLEGLLSRIDREMTADSGPADWAALLGPLFALARALPDRTGLRAGLLRAFFEARGRPDLAAQLPSGPAEMVEEDVIDHLTLGGVPGGDGQAEPESPAAPAPHYAPTPDQPLWQRYLKAGEEVDAVHSRIETPPAPPVAPVPLWEQFAGHALPDVSLPEAPPPPRAPDEPLQATEAALDPDESREPARRTVAASYELEPLEADILEEGPAAEAPEDAPAEDAPRADPPGDAPLEEIEERLLGPTAPERRALYVGNLMDGDEADYAAVLRQLDAAPSWTAASKIIAREVFRRHRVNIYSEAAISFTDAVESRFNR